MDPVKVSPRGCTSHLVVSSACCVRIESIYFIWLSAGIHFDAIELMNAQGSMCKQVASADQSAVSAVEVLMSGLKSSGAFHDRDTLRLKCKSCGQIVNGDYEARSHSGTFNHTEFAPA